MVEDDRIDTSKSGGGLGYITIRKHRMTAVAITQLARSMTGPKASSCRYRPLVL